MPVRFLRLSVSHVTKNYHLYKKMKVNIIYIQTFVHFKGLLIHVSCKCHFLVILKNLQHWPFNQPSPNANTPPVGIFSMLFRKVHPTNTNIWYHTTYSRWALGCFFLFCWLDLMRHLTRKVTVTTEKVCTVSFVRTFLYYWRKDKLSWSVNLINLWYLQLYCDIALMTALVVICIAVRTNHCYHKI